MTATVHRLNVSVDEEAFRVSEVLLEEAGELKVSAQTLVEWPFDPEARRRARFSARQILCLCDELERLT